MMLRPANVAYLAGLLLGSMLLAGCQPDQPDAIHVDSSNSPTETTGGGEAAASGPRAISLADVKLEVVDGAGYNAALAKHAGNVVLVDFWATWCDPCTENFPHIVELHHKHAGQGLRVIGFSTDNLKDADAVRQFLAKEGAAFDNLQSKFGISTETNDTFEIFGVPYYKLYDRNGALRYRFPDDGPLESIDQRVAELLAEPA